MIIALSEGSWVSIGVVLLMAVLTAFGRYKSKADKADTMDDVEVKIEKKLKPIYKKIESTDKEVKEMNSKHEDLRNEQTAISTKLDFVILAVGEIKDLLNKDKK